RPRGPQRLDGVPVLRAVPEHDGRAEDRVPLADAEGGEGAAHRARGAGLQAAADRAPAGAQAVPGVGWTARARGARPRPGARAEAISLAREGMAAGPTQRFVNARVEVIEPTGADTLIVINLGGHEFTARLDPDASLTPGQDANFLVDLTKLVCFDAKTENLI